MTAEKFTFISFTYVAISDNNYKNISAMEYLNVKVVCVYFCCVYFIAFIYEGHTFDAPKYAKIDESSSTAHRTHPDCKSNKKCWVMNCRNV